MAKKHGLRWHKKKTWDEFSILIRLRDAIETTGTTDYLVCCSCSKTYPAFGKGCAQAGHLVPGHGNSIMFDERGVHGQCFNCNLRLKGNWPGYVEFMKRKYCPNGQEVIDNLLFINHQVKKYTVPEYEEMRQSYKVRAGALRGQ